LEQLLNEIKLNSHFIYVDFTYSPYDLDQIKVYPSIKKTNDSNKHISLLLSMKPTSNQPLPIDDKTINILLLGKSDVGKTTLINTLKDYLQFNRYEDAQSNRYSTKFFIPFVYRIRNDLFEEHFIRIGICDPNENHDHPDQSITQQCKLYRFNLKNNEKLCIIDTPGFDKTDNKDNDDITMQHILSRIINLTHLNAICILIQSDDIKLDHYQICLTKLFHFLGNNASKNILFCFTKSLSKNINNDDKRNDLIKLMLQSLPTSNISFNEETTFDFDSTYFINSTISNLCTSFQNSSYQLSQRSWTISKNGWDRLLNYISQNLRHPYYIQQGLQKIQLSRFEINQLIRPLLETIRNNIRNFILSRTVYSNYSIELHPIPLMYPSAICYSCKPSYYQCGDFWISSDSPHEYRNKCYECSCNPEQHIRIDYRLICTYLNNQYRQSDISRRDLIRISAYLSYFLLKEHYTTNNDLFLFHLNKIIDEERSIYQNLYPHRFNLELYKHLMYFRHDYQQEINRIKQKNLNDDFDIDDLIEKVKQIPIIKIQLDAARNMQETSLETHLYQRQLFH
jgi:GTPase SAR1 family protein